MTDKELKRLSRGELLEMLIAQASENEKLKQELEDAQAALQDRSIAIDNAGSIAEAFYGVPEELKAECRKRMPEDLLAVLRRFDAYLAAAEE